MYLFITMKKETWISGLMIGIIFIISIGFLYFKPVVLNIFEDQEIGQEIQNIFDDRNQAILMKDIKRLEVHYNREVKYGVWAYEHELKKMKYLHQWSEKQGIKFTEILSKTIIRGIRERENGLRVNLMASTEYRYAYLDEPEKVNTFRIGTYHSLDITEKEGGWVITREWYTDPFADSLHLDNIKTQDIKDYINGQKERNFTNLIERRKNALEYADQYCGAAAQENYNYNKKYLDYNPKGGDCANFASQILYEGGKFRKNYTWNYEKGGSKAWVNAQAFKDYMVYSGRASVVAYGTYEKVYKGAYKLEPGDFVAYEKKGKVTHISVISGADAKGYALVNSHNTDRYRVPWDLGWNDKGIKFWLVRVHF